MVLDEAGLLVELRIMLFKYVFESYNNTIIFNSVKEYKKEALNFIFD